MGLGQESDREGEVVSWQSIASDPERATAHLAAAGLRLVI